MTRISTTSGAYIDIPVGLYTVDQYNIVLETLTDMPSAEAFFGGLGLSPRIFPVDLTNFRQVRIWARVTTTNASLNTPRLRVRYKTGARTAILTDYADIGTTEVSASLAANNNNPPSWVDLAAAAKAPVWVTVTTIGGNDVIDGAVSTVRVEYRD
jgi:hypothetical protein